MKIDYDEVARDYDTHRSGDIETVRLIADRCCVRARSRVLDGGCGTGNYALLLNRLTGAATVGLDRSAGMLEKASAKQPSFRWVQGDLRAMPFRARSFDLVYCLYVLHHLPNDLDAFCDEMYRVLDAGTVLLISTPRDQIERHPLNQFFPSFARIDLQRFPMDDDVVHAMTGAGFGNVKITETVAAEPLVLDRDYYDRVAAKWISTLRLIPEGEFRDGLIAMRHVLAGDEPFLARDYRFKRAIFTGSKQ